MSDKKIDKVCIDCINANEHLKISSDFKVGVEYGTCDCCGKRYIVVPFRRFFSENVKINPCKNGEIENSTITKEVVKEDPRVEELKKEQEEHIKLIRELQNKIGELEGAILDEVQKAPEEENKEPTKSKDKKPKDLDKVYE